MLVHQQVCLIKKRMIDSSFNFKEMKSRNLPGFDPHSPQAFEPKVNCIDL
jgi:hypothetical protein